MIRTANLKKIYRVGRSRVHALNGVDLEIAVGEFCAIVGTSGSGKSTLLNLLAGLEPPTRGTIRLNGRKITGLSEKKLVDFRREHVGFIFQSFNLIPTMTALENVTLPLIFQKMPPWRRQAAAAKMLNLVGLSTHKKHKPSEMSGGQQQRVGIARALVARPCIVFADEPTGNLDSKTSAEILGLMQQISKSERQTLVMVTHDERLAQYADRVFRISDGQITGIETGSKRHEIISEQQPDETKQD